MVDLPNTGNIIDETRHDTRQKLWSGRKKILIYFILVQDMTANTEEEKEPGRKRRNGRRLLDVTGGR